MEFKEISAEALRLVANMESNYDSWLTSRRAQKDGRLQWKSSHGKDYLYRVRDYPSSGTSLGARSPETEEVMEKYQIERKRGENAWDQLIQEAPVYRALRLPRIPAYAGDVLREMDIEGLLGTDVLVVGTNALCVYELEANHFLDGKLAATEDFDMTYVGELARLAQAPDPRRPTIFGVLKQVDHTYTINTERTFQARNSDHAEVELLVSQERANVLPRNEQLRPIPLPEQDWLLPGRRISHVVCDMGNKPAQVVAPDPRWFALHKLWLADKESRNPLKVTKDRAQGTALLHLVRQYMPHLKLDDQFERDLPVELKPYLATWRESVKD